MTFIENYLVGFHLKMFSCKFQHKSKQTRISDYYNLTSVGLRVKISN